MQDPNTSYPALYTYPLRGFGVVAIFLSIGPFIQTIAASYLFHQWVGGADLLNEIVEVFVKEAKPRILSGYSYYMPSVFLSGIICSLKASRGFGLSLSGTILRTILVTVLVELFYLFMLGNNFDTLLQENNIKVLFFAFIQALAVAWICFIVATGFRIDKPVII